MIEIKNADYYYGKKHVLENISLTFEEGKVYTVIGPNGSGKTTLLSLIAGLTKQGKEKFFIDGVCCKEMSKRDIAKKIALLPQTRITPNFNVFDLVACARFPHLDFPKNLRESDIAQVCAALEKTNVSHLAERRVNTLSGGEMQRVYIAMLLAQDTPYILLDEPGTHLDISSEIAVSNLIREMKKDGKCAVAVMHNIAMALKLADTVIVLDKGKIRYVGRPNGEKIFDAVENCFGVKMKIVENEYFFTEI